MDEENRVHKRIERQKIIRIQFFVLFKYRETTGYIGNLAITTVILGTVNVRVRINIFFTYFIG